MTSANNDLAIADDPYSLSQDVASAVKCFKAECWYNTVLGVPYFEEIFGKQPNITLINRRVEDAAMSVTGVIAAKCVITKFTQRDLFGQIQFTDKTGVVKYVNI